jgi:hypothetical protein
LPICRCCVIWPCILLLLLSLLLSLLLLLLLVLVLLPLARACTAAVYLPC